MTTGSDTLVEALADDLARHLTTAGPGHCLRVDDVDEGIAARLVVELSHRLPDVDVLILRGDPRHMSEVFPERAIELRNRKLRPLLLLVPLGEGGAASSLDNSFERLPALEAFKAIERSLRARLANTPINEAISTLRRTRRGQAQAWAEFLAELCVSPLEETLGRNLWRIGLTPDLGTSPSDRLELNTIATNAISRPTRPTSSLDERFTVGGLAEGAWRAPLRAFCQSQQLSNPQAWAKVILDKYPHLSFDNWRLADALAEDLELLELDPFLSADGKLARSGLRLDDDGELTLEVPDGQAASLTVTWKTFPHKVAAVAKWRLEVLAPRDLRDEDADVLSTLTVRGDRRRGTLKVTVDDEEALSAGNRFVVSLAALGEHGEPINLVDGSTASAESQEFQVLLGEEPPSRTRRAASSSLPEAAVRAALDGMDDLTEDQVTWDLPGQVFGVRLGNRRSVQIRVSAVLVHLQRLATANADQPSAFQATARYGTLLVPEDLTAEDVDLPRALKRARADLLKTVQSRFPRDTAESLAWDAELITLTGTYLAAFRRALENAQDTDSLAELLRLDTLSLSVRLSNATIHAVVLPPLHPLRLAWVSVHDRVLRQWADALVGISKLARKGQVDLALMSRIVPANYPFTVLDLSGRVAVYAEELSHGAALYLIPNNSDSEASAEAVAGVLGLERKSAGLTASSALVAERLRAYDLSHRPGESLRVLALRPGAGQLLADAIEEFVAREEPDQETADGTDDPHRLEVINYTDSASYSRPVPALLSLQDRLRDSKFARASNHLLPPLSLTVRSSDALLEDAQAAHLALVQDVGTSRVDWARPSARAASFHDLLVPITTSRREEAGGVAWDSTPVTGTGPTKSDPDLASAHAAHQRAIARLRGRAEGAVPAVTVALDGDHLAQVRSVHDRADWVISVDRFVGVDLYEAPRAGESDPYILDYAPDFVEGIGDRLTVTTSHRHEVEALLTSAMTDLGLHEVTASVGSVLATLAVVSGRLALRLLGDTTRAREAVSLAAVIAHLRDTGELDEQIVIPVDAHNEIFGASLRNESDGNRRCDLLLVKVGQRSFKIECVEVKSRKEARLPQALADIILDQLTDTRRVLESRFFANDPPRVDRDLQRARLSSLLHYYADRSAAHGLIPVDKLDDIHRYIDRVEETGQNAEITMRGFVISLDGNHGMKKRYGDVPMTVLTAGDLGKLGLTTRVPPLASPGPDDSTEAAGDHEPQLTGETTPPQAPPIPPWGEPPTPGPSPEPDTTGSSIPSTEDEVPPSERTSSPSHAAPGRQLREAPNGRNNGSASGAAAHNRPAQLAVQLGQTPTGGNVAWTVSTQGSPHVLVVGIPGQGKSVTTRRIINEFSRQGLPSLVFDFHGDMAASPPHDARVIDAALGLPFSPFEAEVGPGRPINTAAWQIAEIIGFVTQLGRIQQNHVYKALVQTYREHGWEGTSAGATIPTMHDFADAVEAVETGAQGRNARERLSPLTDFGLFADNAAESFALLSAGRGAVVDLSRLGLEEVQAFGAAFVLRRVYREMFGWGQDSTLRLAVVLDEAHRMAKDPTLPLLMKEGRKFGVPVVVSSQSVEDFHDDVLRNVGAKIIFRTNYPSSRRVAGLLRGRGDADLSPEIEKLGVGVAYVSTPDETRARRVYMAE